MKNYTNDIKKINYGLALLRMLMCFEVVLCHFYQVGKAPAILYPFWKIKGFAVPVFMFMSFYLTAGIYSCRNGETIRKRLIRVIWPQIAWAVVYWLIYNALNLIRNVDLLNGKTLIWQILTGNSQILNPSMWYQFTLIVLTLLFFAIFTYLPNRGGIILIFALAAVALFMQYSGINFRICGRLRYEFKAPVGRFMEMLPIAVLGFSFSYFHIYDKLKKYWLPVSVVSLLLAVVIVEKNFLACRGFGYCGVRLIMVAALLTTAAYMIPFDRLGDSLKKVIITLTRYTLGIYCIHRLVAHVLFMFIDKFGWAVSRFTRCIIIYAISYGVCLLVSRIPLKPFRDLVE